MDVRQNRYGERVWYHSDDGSIISVPKGWTNLAEPDPFLMRSGGKACFRPGDLVRLVEIVDDLRWQETDVEEGYDV
jgi:hypothetical protein